MDTQPGALASPDEDWLSVAEAARHLKNGRSLVYRLVRDGRLEAADDSQPVRISAASLARYQTEQRPPGAQLTALRLGRPGSGQRRRRLPRARVAADINICRGDVIPLRTLAFM